MYRCNDNVVAQDAHEHQQQDHQHDESHPSFVHKIADKLGIHSSHKHDDHEDAKASHSHTHDDPGYEAVPLNNQHGHDQHAQPGVVHKIADKLGIHQDHQDKKEHQQHVEKVETAPPHAHDHVVADMDGYPVYPPDRLDNDPNHQFTHHEDNKDQYSPEFADRVKQTLGIHSDQDNNASSDHHHQTADEADLFGAPSAAQHGHGHDNLGEVNTTSADFAAAQAHKEDSPGFADKIKSKLGIHSSDKQSDHHHEARRSC